jgi:hypothetical protein
MRSNSTIRVWKFLPWDLRVSKINDDHGSLLKGDGVVDLAPRLVADLHR